MSFSRVPECSTMFLYNSNSFAHPVTQTADNSTPFAREVIWLKSGQNLLNKQALWLRWPQHSRSWTSCNSRRFIMIHYQALKVNSSSSPSPVPAVGLSLAPSSTVWPGLPWPSMVAFHPTACGDEGPSFAEALVLWCLDSWSHPLDPVGLFWFPVGAAYFIPWCRWVTVSPVPQHLFWECSFEPQKTKAQNTSGSDIFTLHSSSMFSRYLHHSKNSIGARAPIPKTRQSDPRRMKHQKSNGPLLAMASSWKPILRPVEVDHMYHTENSRSKLTCWRPRLFCREGMCVCVCVGTRNSLWFR